jgi:transcriptional regulator GlxA family with amidase domain
MFGVAGLAEPIAAVVEAMAMFLFATLDLRKARRLPGNSPFPGAGTAFAGYAACFMPFNFSAQKLPVEITGRKERNMKFGIFIYDGVEPIDLATFGVLSMARRIRPDIEICTLAPAAGAVKLSNGLVVMADHALGAAPRQDVIVITGGPGWESESQRPQTLLALRQRAADTLLVSVCTGGMILGASGVLDGKRATTKREVVPPEPPPIQRMRELHPLIDVREASLVDEDRVITGGGVSLCIDAMLHLLKRFYGADVADETARILEYQRAWSANLEQFPPLEAAR